MHSREYPTRKFGQAELRFCRETKGILRESHKNVVATRMERRKTHRGPRAGEGNMCPHRGKDLQIVVDTEDHQPNREKKP